MTLTHTIALNKLTLPIIIIILNLTTFNNRNTIEKEKITIERKENSMKAHECMYIECCNICIKRNLLTNKLNAVRALEMILYLHSTTNYLSIKKTFFFLNMEIYALFL